MSNKLPWMKTRHFLIAFMPVANLRSLAPILFKVGVSTLLKPEGLMRLLFEGAVGECRQGGLWWLGNRLHCNQEYAV